MASGRWLPRQSVMLLAAAGLLLPTIIVLAIQFNRDQVERRRAVERDALAVSRQVVELADAEVSANLRMLRLVANAGAFVTHDWRLLNQLAVVQRRANPNWQAVVLRNRKTGEVLLENGSGAIAGALRDLPAALPMGGFVEGVFREGRYCPCVVLHLRTDVDPDVVISVYFDPHVFQKILTSRIRPGTVAAIVDAEGRFLARSINYEARVGTPGTVYVRRAVAAGGRGLYHGTTYEGLENYTAYTTSALTGWSGHVAVDRSRIDGPRNWSTAARVLAILAALALTFALLAFAAHDLRVRRREESRMLDMQKAEAVSRFTSTVVHDFRNILNVVQAGASLVRRRTDDPHILKGVEALDEARFRGERLVNQLLSFARGAGAELLRVDLQALLEGDQLIRRSLGDDIGFEWTVAPEARFVMVNEDQLELALVNLAVNARDAMDGKGEFRISVSRKSGMAAIDVADTGPGIPPDIRSKILDAFFTTKPDGKGTGLGLAQVAGAVRQAGGRVEVGERPGGGARFVMYLPIAR